MKDEKSVPQRLVERLAAIRTSRGMLPNESPVSVKVDPTDPLTTVGAMAFAMEVLEVLEDVCGVLAFGVHALEEHGHGAPTPAT